MNDPQPIDLRRRIRELNAIPERDRTDAEWDELNELEIRTAPGNRDYDRPQDRQGDRRPGGMGQQGQQGQQGRRQDRNPKQGNKNSNNNPQRQPMQQDGRPAEGRLMKRQHRRPKRQGTGQGGQGQGENTGNTGAASDATPTSDSGASAPPVTNGE